MRRVLAYQLKELELEQECYCCVLRMDLDATRAAFGAWRACVESMLDTGTRVRRHLGGP